MPSITVTAKRETSSLSKWGLGIATSQLGADVPGNILEGGVKSTLIKPDALTDNIIRGVKVVDYMALTANIMLAYIDYQNSLKTNPQLATFYRNKFIAEIVITASGPALDYVIPGLGTVVATAAAIADQAGYLDGLYSYNYYITYTPGSGIVVIPLKIKALESTVGTGEVFSRPRKINY